MGFAVIFRRDGRKTDSDHLRIIGFCFRVEHEFCNRVSHPHIETCYEFFISLCVDVRFCHVIYSVKFLLSYSSDVSFECIVLG